jgi:hypothetical protein
MSDAHLETFSFDDCLALLRASSVGRGSPRSGAPGGTLAQCGMVV